MRERQDRVGLGLVGVVSRAAARAALCAAVGCGGGGVDETDGAAAIDASGMAVDADVADARSLDAFIAPETGSARDATVAVDVERPPPGPGCALRHPPARPMATDSDGPERWYAWRRVSALATSAYDIDGRCTEAGSSDVECASAPGVATPVDGPGGADDAFGSFLFAGWRPGFQDEVSRDLDSGRNGVLIRVVGWSGGRDDPEVDVAVVGGAGTGVPGGMDTPALWDGTDRWRAVATSFVGGDESRPIARDRAAYVADGTLVAQLRDGPRFRLTDGSTDLEVHLTGIVLTADATRDGFLRAGILLGRWSVDDLLGALPPAGVCPGSVTYGAIEDVARRGADVNASADSSSSTVCDAISTGIGFEATAAGFLGPVEPRPFAATCP